MATAPNMPHIDDIRDDFIPKVAFLSREFQELEKERLWPRVWQIACREEELKNVGDFITYDIADESILVLRSAPSELKAFYNVCQHRGRILMDQQHGRTKFVFCKYHGWRWGLDGTLQKVHDEADWEGCPTFSKSELGLKEVHIDTWGGFVFINMSEKPEPLLEFLDPIPKFLDFLKFEEWRYRWYKTVILPCNWKTALEGFNEAYHIAATHPQLLQYSADYTIARTFGRHGMYFYPPEISTPPGAPAPRTGKPMPEDLRVTFAAFYEHLEQTLNAMVSPRALKATKRLLEEVPAGADPMTVLMEHSRIHREDAASAGIDLAEMTNQAVGNMGQNWHMFPNHVFLPMLDGSIAYRARPHGDDPDKCIFDIWSLVRFGPGEEPPLKREFYEDWSVDTVARFGKILAQDFSNFGQTQRGMKSRGFAGSRTNPVQEREIPNMHRALYEFVLDESCDSD